MGNRQQKGELLQGGLDFPYIFWCHLEQILQQKLYKFFFPIEGAPAVTSQKMRENV
jgi:hypothetical protein